MISWCRGTLNIHRVIFMYGKKNYNDQMTENSYRRWSLRSSICPKYSYRHPRTAVIHLIHLFPFNSTSLYFLSQNISFSIWVLNREKDFGFPLNSSQHFESIYLLFLICICIFSSFSLMYPTLKQLMFSLFFQYLLEELG